MALDDDGKSAADVANAVVTHIVDKLAGAKDVATGREHPLFFPNGIELIDVTVTVSGIKAEIKIAGEKGLHLAAAVARPVSADPDRA
jgi:hypothetical protein